MKKNKQNTFCLNDSEKLSDFFSSFYLKIVFYWKNIIGKNNVNKMRPFILKNSHLVIAVPNSMVKSFVAPLKEQIPQKILTIFPDSPIKTVSFAVVPRFFPDKLKRYKKRQKTNQKINIDSKEVEKLKQIFLNKGIDEKLAEKFAEIGAIFEFKKNH